VTANEPNASTNIIRRENRALKWLHVYCHPCLLLCMFAFAPASMVHFACTLQFAEWLCSNVPTNHSSPDHIRIEPLAHQPVKGVMVPMCRHGVHVYFNTATVVHGDCRWLGFGTARGGNV
jgi:hypothetical protein